MFKFIKFSCGEISMVPLYVIVGKTGWLKRLDKWTISIKFAWAVVVSVNRSSDLVISFLF